MDASAGIGRISPGGFASIVVAARRALGWPGRVHRARRLMAVFAALSDHELRDIGLTRLDVAAAGALPLDADPSVALWRRAEERRRGPRPDRRVP